MSLFDFPRIHFSGDLDLNVPTINNTVYYPLTIYDATRSEALLPPRLYFSKAGIVTDLYKTSKIQPPVLTDPNNSFGYVYIEIESINTIEILRTWCMNPIPADQNASNPDAAYVPYYAAAENDLGTQEGMGILGKTPGYWNMFGDMGVKLSNVTVTGVQVFDGTKVNTWAPSDADAPTDVALLLNTSFDFDTAPATGITTATMAETISNQSVYASIFCSNINIYNTANADDIFFQGTPFRFAALIYNAWRTLNWMPPMAGSARFCSSVPMEQIPLQDQSPLIQFFNNNKSYDSRILKGVFVTFTIQDVYENRFDQELYTKIGTGSNPALCTTVVSITPWYDGDMQTGIIGRNLTAMNMQPIYVNKNGVRKTNTEFVPIPVKMAPPIASLKVLGENSAIFSVDMGNSWPEAMTPTYYPPYLPPPAEQVVTYPPFQPTQRGQASFDTMNLGTLSLRYGQDTAAEIASIAINPSNNPRSKVFQAGCIFDFVLTDSTLIQSIQTNLILGFLSAPGTDEVQVLQESEYMFSSDQKGLYADQFDMPENGYQSYNENREPCRLRIYQKGIPVTSPIQVGVAAYIVPEAANDPQLGPDSVKWQMLTDNSIVALSETGLQIKNNAVYYFVYDGQYTDNKIPIYSVNNNYTIMDTGSFVCLRVHLTKDYSMYIDPSNPDYTPPTFDIVYEEVFKMYDVVYPVMALIHPFTPVQWNNPTMSGLVMQRCDPSVWNNIIYMPRSRELSTCQLNLLKAWNEYLNKQ